MLVPLLLAAAALTAALNPEPCAQVAKIQDEGLYDIEAELAYQCLQSIPVDVQGDTQLIDELKIAWQWNSETGELKNVPKTWEYGSLDIEDELDKIKENLTSFNSEFDVQTAIRELTLRTGNYHFNYRPDIIQVFTWSRYHGIVSISKDGKELPKLYLESDISGDGTEPPSEITKINNEDAYEYLQKLAADEQYVDTDGGLNSLFSKGDTYTYGSFEYPDKYPGPTTKFEFADGTEFEYSNIAQSSESFTDISDGRTFFENFCTGLVAGEEYDVEADSRIESGRLGPKPRIPSDYHLQTRQISNSSFDVVIAADSGAVSGYFLNGQGYENVAVLKVITFNPDGDDSGSEFQATIKSFLEACISHNKEKLVIDLRENGGGAPSLVLDMFMQLFPDQEPFSAQRYRAEEQWTAIGETVSKIYTDPKLAAAAHEESYFDFDDRWRYWTYWHYVTPQDGNFKDWQEYVGPEEFYGDSFSAVSRYNTSNNDRYSIVVEGFNFLNTTNRTTPFKAENVVMFTDSLCGSACAGIHEELKNIAGVQSVTVGGPPKNAPIQATSGSKGSEVRRLGALPHYAADILDLAAAIGIKSPTSDKLQALANATQIAIRAGDARSRIQTQDQVRKGDPTGTALEFTYDAADCRIFYTTNSYADTDTAWKAAFDAWQDDSKCVEGSTKHKSSISGGFKPYGPGLLKEGDNAKPNQTKGGSDPSGTATSSGTAAPKSGAVNLRAGSAALLFVLVAVVTML